MPNADARGPKSRSPQDRRPNTRRPRPRAEAVRETRNRVLTSTERLLEGTDFAQLNIGQVLREAGVSRATFYSHYGSKYAVLTELFERTMRDVEGIIAPFPFSAPDAGSAPHGGLRNGMRGVMRVWRTKRSVFLAVADHWRDSPELEEAWLRWHDDLIKVGEAGITRERERGRIRTDLPDRQLAAALVWGSVQTLMITGLGLEPSLLDDEDTVEVLVRIWSGAMYAD